ATLPPGTDISNASNLKTIVMPHGGPETYDAIGFDWMAQYFANRGYLVFQPNFRGSAGYGTAFVLAGNGEWGGKMQDDITDGLKALVNEGLADPDNVCIVGASYGGYAALAGGAFTPDLYRCVVAIAPVTDLHRMLKDEKRDYGRNHWVVDYWQERMADGEARKIKLRSVSPSEYADSFQSPVLLIHGDKDRIVPLKQSEIMHQALLDAGKLVTFITLERGDHALSTNEARLTTLQAASDFVEQHIGSSHSSLSTTPQTFAPSATDGP
ncbi:MAG: alpha/beta fold hydrolase, partial [Pseudomonadota bacterium]